MNRRELIAAGLVGTALAGCASPQAETPITPEQYRKAFQGFAVNVESWWRDVPFEQRFDVAAKNYFSYVEFWFIDSWKRKAVELAKRANDAGVKVAQIVGDAPALAKPNVRGEFLDNVKRAIENAQILGTDIVTLTGHQDVEGITSEDALKSYQDHIAASAELWEDAKIYAAIEPFNPYDHPGHFIYGHREALRICEDINSPYVKINWDLFHMQRHEGELIGNLRRGKNQICYMQLADSPDRHQPGTGEINYKNVIHACREAGYTRPIGLELWAKNDDYAQAREDIYNLTQAL